MNSKTQNKRIFYRALEGISLYVPCRKEAAGKPELQMLRNEHGEQFVPAFFSKRSQKGDFEEKTLVEFPFPLLRHIVDQLPRSVCGVMIEPYEKEICLDRKRMEEYDLFVGGSEPGTGQHAAERMQA